MDDAVAEGGAEFCRLACTPGGEETLLAPDLAPNRGERVSEGSLTVSQSPHVYVLFLQAAGAAWQEVDEADDETATDSGDRVRHMPLRPDRHRAAGSLWVAQVP